MSQETQLTEDERLDWETEKYGTRVVTCYRLSSGRVMVAIDGLKPFEIAEEPFALWNAITAVKGRTVPAYVPPKARSLVRASLMSDEELSAALTELEDLKIDL